MSYQLSDLIEDIVAFKDYSYLKLNLVALQVLQWC